MLFKKVFVFGLASVFSLSTIYLAEAMYRGEGDIIIQLKEDVAISSDYYLNSSVENVMWGRLPNKHTKPVMSIESGATVTIDTISHEGILEDQGKDPKEYFKSHGVHEDHILDDAKALADSSVAHDFDHDGPHVVTGPIEIKGAKIGDVLKVEVLALQPRVPYGVISNRHYKGALPGEFPENSPRQEGASFLQPDKYGNISKFAPIKEIDGIWYSYFDVDGKEVTFPINPFLGVMGVATGTEELVSSVPPRETGGNLDINELGVGSTLYLPVEADGAGFYVGDPHFAQGDGEVALTALEGSLRAQVKLTLLKKDDPAIPVNPEKFTQPFGETEKFWISIGLDEDLDEAMKESVRESISFLEKQLGLKRDVAYAYLSAAVDYEVSQVVDKTKGIHALIPKLDFYNLIDFSLATKNGDIKLIQKDRALYIPLEKVLSAIGATQKMTANGVTISYNNKSIKYNLMSNVYAVDGVNVVLDRSPLEISGITHLPVTALSEVLGLGVTWSTVGKSIIGNTETFTVKK